MAMSCYDGRECDGCMDCLPQLPTCCICGRTIGPYEDRQVCERGLICDNADCRFEVAMEGSDEDLLREFAETEKDSYIRFYFS